jgi:hypothetical protein
MEGQRKVEYELRRSIQYLIFSITRIVYDKSRWGHTSGATLPHHSEMLSHCIIRICTVVLPYHDVFMLDWKETRLPKII